MWTRRRPMIRPISLNPAGPVLSLSGHTGLAQQSEECRLALAAAPFVLFLDGDTILDPDFMARAVPGPSMIRPSLWYGEDAARSVPNSPSTHVYLISTGEPQPRRANPGFAAGTRFCNVQSSKKSVALTMN